MSDTKWEAYSKLLTIEQLTEMGKERNSNGRYTTMALMAKKELSDRKKFQDNLKEEMDKYDTK